MFLLLSSMAFSSTKLKNRRAEQVLPSGVGAGTSGRGEVVGRIGGRIWYK
jgi:hypothetical protein